LPEGHEPPRPGDRAQSLDGLLREHRPAVLALCLAHSRDIHEAEDRVQDAFLKALDKLPTLRDPSRARPWLLQIARRLCIDYSRRRTAHKPITEHPAQPPAAVDERIERLLAAVAKLPDDFRETVVLYYLNGRSCAGVAASLGTSAATVRQRLVRARLRLHELLTEDEP
jgi:RNA polymerase sigma-70 factor (ECF subfamily)